jgi:hypothetical protein
MITAIESKAKAREALARSEALADTDFATSRHWRAIGEAWAAVAVAVATEAHDALVARQGETDFPATR